MHHTATFRKRFSPTGGLPAPLPEVAGWQTRVPRHAVEHLAELAPLVQILDASVPQMVDQLLDIEQFFRALSPVPEQVIEVHKILLDDVPWRTAVRVPQLAEQLVEVPTNISYSSLQRTVEHHVDIPVPGRGGRNVGLQGFPPGQSPTAQHSFKTRISERIMEQIVDIPGGGLQSFRPGQISSSSSHFQEAGVHEGLDEPGEGFFRTSSRGKKSAEVAGQVGADMPRHVSSWTPPAYEDLEAVDEPAELEEDVELLIEEEEKRKKRRKRRLPRTSSLSSPRRRLRQWLLPGWVLLVLYLALCSFTFRQAQDALHHGRFGPEGHLRCEMVVIPVVKQRLISMVLSTMAIPHLQFLNEVIYVLVCRSCRFFHVVCQLCATTGALRSCSSSTRSSTPLSWRSV